MAYNPPVPPVPVKPRKRRKGLIVAIIAVIIIIIIAAGLSDVLQSPQYSLVKMSGSAPTYDEQEIVAFDGTFTALSYNVTAVAQTTASGYGPAYLLNGVSSAGYWYQVGISYRWHYEINGIPYRDPGFSGIYEAFAPNGTSIFPAGGGGGTLYVTINPGDPINLYLAFLSNGTVIFQVTDSKTHSQGAVYFSSSGATHFAALGGPDPNSFFFTGIMTEEYHVHPYYGGETAVTYAAYGPAVQEAMLVVDEYNLTYSGKVKLFFDSSQLVNLSGFPSGYTYSAEGATVIATPLTVTTD